MTDDALVDALIEAHGLKDVARAGWVRRGVPTPESVAAHSWGVAWLALVVCPPSLDRAKVLSYAVLHDVAEVRVGDLTPHDGVSRADKHQREADAMASLSTPLPTSVLATWAAYEAQEDDEARFVRQLDRLDMAVTAVVYALQGRLETPQEFLDSAARAIVDPRLSALLQGLRARLPTPATP